MEDTLKDLLERLSAVATGAANVHEKPSAIVEEVKDVLDHLARDELPAASAVLLSTDAPGALHHLELVRAEVHKPNGDVNTGRTRLLECVTSHIARIGKDGAEPYARDIKQTCERTFRSERGSQRSVKAASLLPIAELFRLGLPRMSAVETRSIARELREDYERDRLNSARVKANILQVIAALHDDSFTSTHLTEEVTADEAAAAVKKADLKPAPTARWLLTAGLATLETKDGGTLLVAEGLDGISSALTATFGEEIESATVKNVCDATMQSLAIPSSGQRTDKTQAALRLVARHADVLAPPPGFMARASECFQALVKCRCASNKAIRTLAVPALDEFLRALSDALGDDAAAPASEREAVLSSLSEEVYELLDSPTARNKEKTAAVRALGKLVRAAWAIGSQATADLDLLMTKLTKLMMVHDFVDGGNDFDRRFEAMERQCVMLSTYTDIISLQPPGTPVEESVLDLLVDILKFLWRHYHTAGDRMQLQLLGATDEFFAELHRRGGSTLLRGFAQRVTRPMVSLTLRVAPPDPIDSHLFRSPPEPLWPRYVSPWTHLLGGDALAVANAPSLEKAEAKTRRRSRGGSDRTTPNREGRQRSLSVSLDRTGDTPSSEGRAPGGDVFSPSLDRIASGAQSGSGADPHHVVMYDSFIDEVLQLCQTLDLDVVRAHRAMGEDPNEDPNDSSQERENGDGEDGALRALALELGEGVAASNAGDMQTFLCLVDLACSVLGSVSHDAIVRWLAPLMERLAALSAARPLLSGFYKIARAALGAANRAGASFEDALDQSASSEGSTSSACRAFLLDVCAAQPRLSDELRASALQLVLSSPRGLLTSGELAAPLRDALRVGLHHPPLASAALDLLETRFSAGAHTAAGAHRDEEERREVDGLLPSVVGALRPYVDRSVISDSGSNSFGDGSNDSKSNEGDPTAQAMYRAKRIAARRAKAADEETARGEHGEGGGVDARVARLLGKMGGAAHALVDANTLEGKNAHDDSNESLWDPRAVVSLELSVGGGVNGSAVRLKLWLDAMLPRAAALALTSPDRASKVAAAEFLHAATLLMVGTNARAAAPKGGDYAREPTRFHHVYRRLFPVVIELAVDPEPVTRMLFSSLAYQLARWFTRNQAREAAETVALLDAITEGLADPMSNDDNNATGSGKTSGATAQRRELCAKLAAECLKWSVKHLPAAAAGGGGSGGAGGAGGGAAVNVKSILRRLFAFQTHPNPGKRLGASVALQRCLAELRQFPQLVEAHALEILETTIRSLRLCEGDPPRAGAEEAGALLCRAAVRACARHAGALCRAPASASARRGGGFETLPRLVEWIFARGTARVETRARLESQLAFAALVQRLPGYTSPGQWLAGVADTVGGPSWPFRVTVARPDGEAVLGNKTEDVAGATAWMRNVTASLHWARWALERNIVTLAMIVRGGVKSGDGGNEGGEGGVAKTDCPVAAAAHFLKVGVPRLPGDDDDDVGRVSSARGARLRDLDRARVKLAVQVMVLAQHAIAKEGNDDGATLGEFLEILDGPDGKNDESGVVSVSDGGLTRLLCLATLAPETLGADVTGGRLDDVNQLAGAAARMLQPMVTEGAARGVPRVAATRRGARDALWRALSSRSDRFDLGSADLHTARGLTAARQLSAGYRALANVNLLRQLLPTEGPASRTRLAKRLLLAASRIGPGATPSQRSAGKSLVTVGVHLGVPAEFIVAIVLGDEIPGDDDANPSGRIERRSVKSGKEAAANGEAFLQNFPKDVAGACRWNFVKYAEPLVARLVHGGSGRTAALRMLSTALEVPAGTGVGPSMGLTEQNILAALKPHVEALATLVETPHSDGNPDDASTRRRTFVNLARRILALDAAVKTRVIFGENGGDVQRILADAIGAVVCSTDFDPEADGAEIGAAQREALSLLPELIAAGGYAPVPSIKAAARLASYLRDGGGAAAPAGSPEAAAFTAVRGVLLDTFGRTRAPELLAAAAGVVASDADGGAGAFTRALQTTSTIQSADDAWRDAKLATEAWTFATDKSNDPNERIVVGCHLLPTLLAEAPAASALVFFTERARRIVDAITPTKESDASPRAAVAGARVAYAALLSLYEKLGKDDVAAGPGGSVDKFNAHCAKYLVSELDGAGVTAVAIADSTNAWNAWKARRDHEAAQPRAMDGSGDGSLDPEPERISTGVKARARLAAFRAYVALVTRTQTKAKFYEAVFEPRGGVAEMTKRWNSLLEPSFKPKLEVEARLVSDRAARRTKASGRNPAAAPVEPTLPFTLSATLAAGDATLGAPPVNPSSVPDDDRAGSSDLHEGQNDENDENDEGPLDELETHPLASSVFAALEHVARGVLTDFETNAGGCESSPKLVQSLSALLREPAVGHAPRLLVVKALLRLHRKEVDAFQSARIAAEETRLRRAARGDADDNDKTGSQEIELLAERSPEELEAEKVEQAKRDGNFFNLADSQPVDEDGPTLPSEPADDTDDDATPRSFLERHARTLLPAVLRATLDASSQEKCDVLHATLRETAVAALECVSAWRFENGGDVKVEQILREFTAHVVRVASIKAPYVLRQNISLVTQLTNGLVRSSVRRARAESLVSDDDLDRVAAGALTPALDSVIELIDVDPALGSREEGRTMRACGVQIVGALAMAGTLDLGGHVPRVRHGGDRAEGEAQSAGWAIDADCKFAYICAGVATCLMDPGASTGRPLHAAAASLLGVALHQGAERRRRGGDVDDDEADESEAKASDPKWHSVVKKRLRKLYDAGPQDAFITACERIARRCPSWLLTDSSSAITQLNTLLPKVHGEPRFVALSALAKVAGCDTDASAAFADAILPTLPTLLAARDPQIHVLVLRSLAKTLPDLAEEARRWPHGRKIDEAAWRIALEKTEKELWGAADSAVRDAHAGLCVAVAQHVPSLAESPAVRSPLLRALAEGGGEVSGGANEDDETGEDANQNSSTSAVLKHWHAHLPGSSLAAAAAAAAQSRSTAVDSTDANAAAGNLGRRLCAALRTLPTGEDSASLYATASGWLAAACHVVLAVPRSESAYRTPVFDSDLMDCEFHEAFVDTAWQGASLPMAPLFSSQSSQGIGDGSFGSMTQSFGSMDSMPSLASSRRPAVGLGGGGRRVLATPVARASIGATFSTQFGAATLTAAGNGRRNSSVSNSGGVEALSTLGFSATQAELPPWLRRSATSTQGGVGGGGDTDFDAPSSTQSISRRVIHGSQSVSWVGGGGGGGAQSVVEGGRNAMIAAAERRRRHERERAKTRRHAVRLTRTYRAGELPDVRAVTPASLLDPLAALALRDPASASALLRALTAAALAADDRAVTRADVSTGKAAGTKRKSSDGPRVDANDDAGPLRKDIRAALRELLPASGADPTLATWALEQAASDPGALFEPGDVSRVAYMGGGLIAHGIVALEARALHSNRISTEYQPAPRGPKRAKTSGSKDSPEKDSASLWNALAGLYRAAGDENAARLCLKGALDDDPVTAAALTAQLEGDAGGASDIYLNLLESAMDTDGPAPTNARLWERERLRCLQRLGKWQEVLDDCQHIRPKVDWDPNELRSFSSDESESFSSRERAVSGSAVGGDVLNAAVRAMLRLGEDACSYDSEGVAHPRKLSDFFKRSAKATGQSGWVAEELGVEIAAAELRDGVEDVALTRIAALRRCFRRRWIGSHPAATSVRRALLQPLQPAAELEEALELSRLARKICGGGGNDDDANFNDASAVDIDAGAGALESMLERWRTRWPSDALDPPEAWERVVSVRRVAIDAFNKLAPQSFVRGKTVRDLLERDRCVTLLRSSKGLMRSGELTTAMAWCNEAMNLVKERSTRLGPTSGPQADEMWRYTKALCKVKLEQCRAPAGFEDDGTRASVEGRNALGLNTVLSYLVKNWRRGEAARDLGQFPNEAAECAAMVGRVAAALSPIVGHLNDDASPVGDNRALSKLALESFEEAVEISKSHRGSSGSQGNEARGAAKASLRLALYCDELLKSPDDSKSEYIRDLGLEPSLVRHALLALAGGASGVPRARHLIPRVLALLRGGSDAYGQTVNASDAVANEFASFVSKVPPWLFVEWVPQMLSSLEIPGAGGDALVPCLESLASEYPSAVHPDFHLSRAHFTELGVGRSRRLHRMLHSHSRDAFTRAVTLLDFPHKRLEWWRQHLKMLAHAGTSDEVLSAIADEMVRDVADPDEPMLGNLNARFAQVARGPLTKAIGGSDRAIRLRKGELARWLPQAVAEAERKIVEQWMKQFGKAQELPRQRVTQFSQWFASFEPPVAGGAGVTGRRHLSPTFRMGIEVPGQYDALTGPPDVTSHAQIVGFEPEVDLFRSKQFPKKLVARGSDGREYPFVAKGSEDLRQDDRIERLFRAMDALLAAHPGSRNRGLSVRTFHVAPLSARCGLLEFVGGTTPVLEACRGSTKQGNVCIKEHQHWIRAQASARDKDVTAQNATIDPKNGMYRRRAGLVGAKYGSTPANGNVDFLTAMARCPRDDASFILSHLGRVTADAGAAARGDLGDDGSSGSGSGRAPDGSDIRPVPAMRRALTDAAGSPDAFLAMRRRYGATLAASSVCGWVAGVGDRHLQNVLVDLRDGSLVHIDFGYAFGTATAILPIPELTPFRATPAMMGPLAPHDAHAALRGDMAQAMHALRRGSALLRGVMDVFLREPLIDWQREARLQSMKSGRAAAKTKNEDGGLDQTQHGGSSSATIGAAGKVDAAVGLSGDEARVVELKVAHAYHKLELGNPCHVTLAQCAPKHEGQAHWAGMTDLVFGRHNGVDGVGDVRANAGEVCASVEEQVECLLALATDPGVLANGWSGWRPWL